jgi:hypothetical protein
MYFLILTVIFLLPLSAQASDDAKTWKYKAWEVKDRGNFLLSSTQGEVVWGHQFGVLTPKNNCGANYLWLSLSTSEKGIEELKGQQIPVEIRVDKDIYQTTLEVQTLFQMGSTTVVGFNPFLLNKSFLENLKKGRELFVKIEDEGGFSNMFDIKEESFSLRGFTANYVKLSESCKDITQLEIPPNKVGLKAEYRACDDHQVYLAVMESARGMPEPYSNWEVRGSAGIKTLKAGSCKMTILFVTGDPHGKMTEVDVLYQTNISLSKIRVQPVETNKKQ